jgi:hypothetical protein
MKKRLPLLLTIFGLLFLVASFVYDVAMVNIPAQDAPPHIEEQYREQYSSAMAVSTWLRTIGIFATIIGGFLFLVRVLVQRRPPGT